MPNTLLVLILSVVFTAVLATGQGLYWAWVAKKEREQEELLRRLGSGGGGPSGDANEAALFRDQAADSVAGALGSLGESLQNSLRAADAGYSVTNLLIRCAAVAVVGALLGMLLVHPVIGLVFAAVGYVPIVLVQNQARARVRRLVEQLPDSLELMARALSAGVGLSDAFRMVQEEMPMPIAAEFGRVQEEVRYGRDYREAFDKMLERNPGVFDLRIFVSSVMLQRDTGGNLIEILENISDTIRSRFLFDAKVRAMTSEARFSALILGGLPIMVALVLMVMNPTYLVPLVTTPLGYAICAICVLMYIVGILLMVAVSSVEV
ncbi:MAG: type II secretion system F family protein [Myxococcota bacterium]